MQVVCRPCTQQSMTTSHEFRERLLILLAKLLQSCRFLGILKAPSAWTRFRNTPCGYVSHIYLVSLNKPMLPSKPFAARCRTTAPQTLGAFAFVLFGVAAITAGVLYWNSPAEWPLEGPTYYDRGPITTGSSFTHQFAIRNVSDHALRLVRVEANCGCTDAHLNRSTILPDERAQLQLTMTADHPGDRSADAFVVYEFEGTPDHFARKFTVHCIAQ